MKTTIEQATEASRQEMLEFLKRYENTALFLLGNAEAHGLKLGQSPYSGNYKLLRQGGKIVGVFCLFKNGSLLVQAEVTDFALILEACKEENIPVRGCIGEWEYCSDLWAHLRDQKWIATETFRSKEILHSLELAEWPGKESQARPLIPEDYDLWRPLRLDYVQELKYPTALSEEQMHHLFLSKTASKSIWGAFVGGKLAATADLNAKALDLGQVGGVYTAPAFRKQGIAKGLIHRLMDDAKHVHGIRKLIIFTGEENLAARKLYQTVGAKTIGHFALFFGKSN